MTAFHLMLEEAQDEEASRGICVASRCWIDDDGVRRIARRSVRRIVRSRLGVSGPEPEWLNLPLGTG